MAVAKKTKNLDAAMQFLTWATSKDLAKRAMLANITMARSSAWADAEVQAKVTTGLVDTRAFAAKNGIAFDRPYMSAVGEARDRIGELVIASINSSGAGADLDKIAANMVAKVNELLEDTGEFGQ
jgi:multiple sugar transport system substrate-binding protein